ncbi:MAG: hypothetical protein B9S30_08015 [Verrucomicrobiia bacterium Tous-C5FEB]|nr:MAG: hypothetical protein B9S30_08015 [Verrucomicrobiae bacterium Tous-C5FEB]
MRNEWGAGVSMVLSWAEAKGISPLRPPPYFSARWVPSVCSAAAGSVPALREHRTSNIKPRSDEIGILLFTSTLEIKVECSTFTLKPRGRPARPRLFFVGSARVPRATFRALAEGSFPVAAITGRRMPMKSQ